MSQLQKVTFTLQWQEQEARALEVVSFTGEEGLSRPFEFQVDFTPAEGRPLEPQALLHTQATLGVQVCQAPVRYVQGLIRAVQTQGLHEGRWHYRLWLVPRLWLLTQVQRSRVFHHLSTPQVVQRVLTEARVPHRLELRGRYALREHCTQYQETDFAFISRLLEREGIFYFFEHTAQGHLLVLGDEPSVHAPLPGEAVLPWRTETGRVADTEYVCSLEQVHRTGPNAVHVREYYFHKPEVEVGGKLSQDRGRSVLELYEHSSGRGEPLASRSTARLRLQEALQHAHTLRGRSVCARLTPGYRFEVESPATATWEGQHVLVEVKHQGRRPQGPEDLGTLESQYTNTFVSVPRQVPLRPVRGTPWPRLLGPQTATVVAPPGEEVHTDEYGRIHIRFHWDREAAARGGGSCWARTSQAWSGMVAGAQYLPRDGQEVLVRFEEGDPDRPVVSGVLYNGAHPTPYVLPEERTRSTLKSASTPGGEGSNEVRLEDAAGAEEVYVHAQRNEQVRVRGDAVQEVRGHSRLEVGRDRGVTVEGHQVLRVGGEDRSHVGGHQSLQIHGDRSTVVRGGQDESVEGNQGVNVGGMLTTLVQRAASETVGGARTLTVGGGVTTHVGLALSESVGGLSSTQVGAMSTESVEGHRQETVAGDKQVRSGGEAWEECDGSVTVHVGEDMQVEVGGSGLEQVGGTADVSAGSLHLQAECLEIVVNDQVILEFKPTGEIVFNVNNITLSEE